MKSFQLRHFKLPIVFLGFLLCSCAAASPTVPTTTPTPYHTVTPTSAPPPATAAPTRPGTSQPKTIIIYENGVKSNPGPSGLSSFPNLWTKIEKHNIEVYPFDWLMDYTFDADNALWAVGGFGVLHRTPDGEQTLYSIESDLPRQNFTRIAISPSGEIWAGGTENALFRYDGAQWINEGEKFPPPFDDRTTGPCYSHKISGIDFGPDGEAWVINAGIEIYVQAYGQWVNFPFPKSWGYAGGGDGGCPLWIRVWSEDDLTIKVSGIGYSGPLTYHFNGETWKVNRSGIFVGSDYERSPNTRTGYIDFALGSVRDSGLSGLPFKEKQLLPRDFSIQSWEDYAITLDKNGTLWLRAGNELYNNASGVFEPMWEEGADQEADAETGQCEVINFGTEAFYYQPGKKPVPLRSAIQYQIGWLSVDAIADRLATDQYQRVWLYSPEKGLVMIVDGDAQVFGRVPSDLLASEIGGTFVFNDGRVWVGSAGSVWEYKEGQWKNYVFPSEDQLFLSFGEDESGVVYMATDTAVYTLDGNKLLSDPIVIQDWKPMVISDTGEFGDCSFNKNYTIIANCLGIWGEANADFHYHGLHLDVQADGTVTFINNRVVARRVDGEWKSFLFDDFAIDSATVDKDGYIWIFSRSDGLIHLAPEIFEDYQELND